MRDGCHSYSDGQITLTSANRSGSIGHVELVLSRLSGGLIFQTKSWATAPHHSNEVICDKFIVFPETDSARYPYRCSLKLGELFGHQVPCGRSQWHL
jgi:hypothetical protein